MSGAMNLLPPDAFIERKEKNCLYQLTNYWSE
jgi:hypothetical protein